MALEMGALAAELDKLYEEDAEGWDETELSADARLDTKKTGLSDEEVARCRSIAQDSRRFEEVIERVLADLQPCVDKLRRQDLLVKSLDGIFKGVYGQKAKLDVFGSTICDLAGKGSDLDLTFTPDVSRRLDLENKKDVLRRITRVVNSNGMRAQPILRARVPIVRITSAGVAVDLSVQNDLPVYKSLLLHEYSQLDPRYPRLVLLVKAWAKVRGINSAQHGTFNSFGLSLLVLHYLQQIQPPVLPRLNEPLAGFPPPRSFGECEGILIQHYMHEDLSGWRSENTDSIAMLTHGFFKYFAREFPWDTHAVSVICQAVPKSRLGEQIRSSKNTGIVIQDPLDEDDNCARNISMATKPRILREFERAFTLDLDIFLQEVRGAAISTAAVKAAPQDENGHQKPAPDPRTYKTKLCLSFFKTGECEYETRTGNPCLFAHGDKELRKPSDVLEADVAGGDSEPPATGPAPDPSPATASEDMRAREMWLVKDVSGASSGVQVLDKVGSLLVQELLPSAAILVTAIHRIASITTQPDQIRQLCLDPRLLKLVVGIENALDQGPATLEPQHLAMTVWSAAKLRILRPQIFERVQQELLRPHRSLDYVSSENLVTIAWSFRTVDYNAPRLFKSVWDQSQRRPDLASKLIQLGIFRGPHSETITPSTGSGQGSPQYPPLNRSHHAHFPHPAEGVVHGNLGANDSGGSRPGGGGVGGAIDGIVQLLVEMGFDDQDENAQVLRGVGGDLNTAVDELARRNYFREQQQQPKCLGRRHGERLGQR